MEIGQLRHRVRFWAPGYAENAHRDNVPTMAALSEDSYRWSDVQPLTGEEKVTNNAISAELTHKMRCRYHDALTTKMEVRWGARTFQILSLRDIGSRTREMELMLKELV